MEERGADQEVQIPGAEWLQRNVHQHVQGQQMNGSSFKTPILAGLGRGGRGGVGVVWRRDPLQHSCCGRALDSF